jgi:signal transduction histidine kinase
MQPLDATSSLRSPRDQTVRTLRVLERAMLGVAALITVASLQAYVSRVDVLDWLPEPTPFKFNAGVALLALVLAGAWAGRRRARPLAALALAIGVVTALEYVLGRDLGIDELVFDEFSAPAEAGPHPGRMAPNTAIALILLATATLVRRRSIATPAAIAAAAIGFVGILGYTASDASALSRIGSSVRVSLPTAMAVLLTGGAIVVRRECGWIGRASSGGVLVRRLLPYALAVPVALGTLWLQGTRNGWFTADVGVWLLTLATVLVSAGAVIWMSVRVDEREAANAAELERSNRELDEFATIVSHDLVSPLRQVSGFVELLRHRYGGRLDADADELIAGAVAGAEDMQAMLDALLEYSRVGRRALRREPVDAGAVAQQALDRVPQGPTVPQADVEIAPLPVLSADPALLAQVFQNLLGNAVRHGGGRVVVSTAPDGGNGNGRAISVRDHGPGVPEADRDRVFTMFARGRTPGEGSGVGLAVCRRIVERHGGRIWCVAGEHAGTTIRFTLPAAE